MATKKAASTKKSTTTKKSNTSSATKTTVKTAPATAKKQSLSQHVESSLLSTRLWRALAAEFIGTFLLAGIILATQGQPLFVALGLVGIVLLVGTISGAHVNPAVTVGAWATRRIGWLRAVCYLFVQFLGAAAAFFLFSAFLSGAPAVSQEAIAFGQQAPALFAAKDLVEGKEWYVFFAELVGTAILGFAVAHATRLKDNLTAAFSVGLGILIAILFGITAVGFIGASTIINPAVAVALQAYGGEVWIWSYVVWALAPVIGGVVGFVLYDLIRGKNSQ